VVKVGTSTITHKDRGSLDLHQLERLVRQISDLANRGMAPMLVTSGAIGAGMNRLGLVERPASIKMNQAVAAVGQGLLMEIYTKLFGEYGHITAQLLLTRSDLEDRKRYLNSRGTLLTLLDLKVVPVINENDTVAVDEIRFGDNDTLSALVAGLVDADLLIILSDVNGVYTADPRVDESARLLTEIETITPALEAGAGQPGSALGTGGMVTKIQAARVATSCGIPVIIASGREHDIIHRLLEGEGIGTFFHPAGKQLSGRKRWIAYHRRPQGSITVDTGAARAMVSHGKSLLPVGIKDVKGTFCEGDLVRIQDERGIEIARGLSNYSVDQVRRIMGLNSEHIEEVLGYKYDDTVVHRDNMVVSCLQAGSWEGDV